MVEATAHPAATSPRSRAAAATRKPAACACRMLLPRSLFSARRCRSDITLLMEGVDHTSNIVKKGFHVTANPRPLQKLHQLSLLLPQDNRRAFARKYGSTLDLLSISVQPSVLTALAGYWSPTLRCFELPNIDITPTIEEYACMLKWPVTKSTLVYSHMDYHASITKLAEQFGELLGVSTARVRLAGHADSKGVTSTFIEAHLEDLARQEEWIIFARVLALGIFGLVLFPSALNIIDQAAMDVFYTVEHKKRNPVPTILVETFLTLSFCHQKKKGKLRCCLHLLYVWIVTHMHSGNCNTPIFIRS